MSKTTRIARATAPRGKVVAIQPHVLDTIRRHGAWTFPDECCGALIERDGAIVVALALENTTRDAATRRFRIGPDAYRKAETFARAAGGMLVGFYHSHPDAPPRPSQYDLDHAWPNLAYLILAVNAGLPGDAKVWHLRDDRSGFDEGELQWHTRS